MRLREISLAVCAATVVAGSTVIAAPAAPTAAQRAAQVDDNEIVSCLLPARVRKLGGMVYPERRKLDKSTAKVCTLRGGEYTVYDRARPDSSVAFFKPLAEAGDPDAQTSLGEVFEYVYDIPRYEDAAHWYSMAAEQNHPTAQRRLAYLYENGLGVERDLLRATNLYRQSSGAGDALVLASEVERVQTAAEARIAELTEALRRRNAEAADAQLALEAARKEVAAQRDGLAAAERDRARVEAALASAKAATASTTDVAAMERDLAERRRTIEDQQYRIASLEADLQSKEASLTANLKRAELENKRLAAELERVSARSEAQIASSRSELEARSSSVAALQSEHQAALAQIAQQRAAMAKLSSQLESLRAQTAGSSSDAAARLAQLEAERAAQAAAIAEAESRQTSLAQRIAAAEAESASLRTSLASVARERDVLDAELASRSQRLVAVEADLARVRSELARTQESIAQNEQERVALKSALAAAQAGSGAMFAEVQAKLQAKERELEGLQRAHAVALEAVRGYQADVAALQAQQTAVATKVSLGVLPDTSRIRLPPGVSVGRYYALVMGNDEYQALRPLSFAVNGAKDVAQVLRDGYQFETTELYNVDSKAIFAAFKSMQDKLKPEDSLVIYFAGRGREVVNNKDVSTYWLGVDAPPAGEAFQSQAVSSMQISEWLKALPARHVLVVADSCYSGRWVHTSGGMKLTASDIADQLKFSLQQQSRTLIASGFPNPVTDDSGKPGSVFTRRLVELLVENRGVLVDDVMYSYLRDRIAASAGVPAPVFGSIANGGHEAGQFVFIRPAVLTI